MPPRSHLPHPTARWIRVWRRPPGQCLPTRCAAIGTAREGGRFPRPEPGALQPPRECPDKLHDWILPDVPYVFHLFVGPDDQTTLRAAVAFVDPHIPVDKHAPVTCIPGSDTLDSFWAKLSYLEPVEIFPPGPAPLRARHPDADWNGLPQLCGDDRDKVDMDNALMQVFLDLASAVLANGGHYVLEHPHDPGHPFPSIWACPHISGWLHAHRAHLHHFDACEFMMGDPTKSVRKPTTMASDLEVQALRRCCSHP
eukprot:4948990-Amphidinium_carterae.2